MRLSKMSDPRQPFPAPEGPTGAPALGIRAALAFTLLSAGVLASRGSVVDPALPTYEPHAVAPPAGSGYVLRDGSIQIVAFAGIAGPIDALDKLFAATHSGLRLATRSGSDYSAASSLLFDASLIAPMGSEITLGELTGFAKLLGPEPLGIRIAHASLRTGAKISPLAVIVNPRNPLTTLTVGQLRQVFATGASKGDITSWTQLGVKTGDADQTIHPCGPPESDDWPSDDADAGRFMVQHVLDGNHFPGTYQMFARYADIVQRVKTDPNAIGLAAFAAISDGVKVVGLAADAWTPPSRGSANDIVAGYYPLDRYLYLYIRRLPGTPIDPVAREYARMVLSKEGQQAIADDSENYLPLNPREVSEELAKLR